MNFFQTDEQVDFNYKRYEVIDVNRFMYLQTSDKISQQAKEDLKTWRNKSKNRDNVVKIQYCIGKNQDKGRLYPRGGIGLGSFSREIRGFLSEPIYYDVDIVNSHPRLLYELSKKLNYNAENLKHYIVNREQVLDEIMKQGKLQRHEAKVEINRVLNCGSVKFEILKPLEAELINLRKLVRENFKELVKPKDKESQVFSIVLNHFEHKILQFVVNYFEKMNWNVDVLIHDGIQVQKKHPKDRSCDLDMMKCCESFKQIFGFEFFNLERKPFSHPFKDFDQFKVPKVITKLIQCEQVFTEMFKHEIYYDVNDKLFKFLEDGEWVDDVSGKKLYELITKSKEFHNRLGDFSAKLDKSNVSQLIQFLKCSLYKETVFEPWEQCENNVINKFKGFQGQYTPEVSEEDIQPFLNHLKVVLCNENEEKYDLILNWIAQIVQRGRNETSLVIIGDMGDGKSYVFEYLREFVFGQSICKFEDNSKNVFGDFNSSRYNQLLVVLEEASSGMDFNSMCSHIKQAITGLTFECRKMHTNAFTCKNYNNFVFLTNSRVPVKIEESDRRHNIFVSSSKYKQNTEYFDTLHSITDNAEFGNKVYSFFKDRDITDYNPRKIIKTGEQRDLILEDSSVGQFIKSLEEGQIELLLNEMLFDEPSYNKKLKELEECLTNGQYFEMSSKQFYEAYTRFYDEEGYRGVYKRYDSRHFGQQFKKMWRGDIEFFKKSTTRKVKLQWEKPAQ